MQAIRFFSNARRLMVNVALIAILLALSTMASVPHAQAAQMLPVESLLNPDGTLNTSTGASGALDLRGWNVTLDAERGPLFQPVDGFPARPSDGTWSALGPGINGSAYNYAWVNAIAVSGSDVYVGGVFTQVGTVGVNNIAKWDGSTWSALGTGANADVEAIAVSGSDVYVGGAFFSAGGVTNTNHIAKWDGSAWSALDTGTHTDAFQNAYASVYAIAVSGSNVYVGGGFDAAGSVRASRIAKWDGSAWSALGTGTDGGGVTAIAVSGSDVYVGGGFPSAGDVANTNNIAKWDGSAWSALGTGTNDQVRAIAVSGSNVYVGGYFTSAGTCSTANGCNHIAKWDGNTWSALSTGTNNYYVSAIVVSGSNVYVGGFFTSAGGVANTNFIAKWDGNTWSALGTGTNGQVSAIAVSGSNVYVGGGFTRAGTVANTTYIAEWGGSGSSSHLYLPLIIK